MKKFKEIKADLIKENKLDVLAKRVVSGDKCTTNFYDTWILGFGLSGKELRDFYKMWFRQKDEYGDTAVLFVNKKRSPLISGSRRDKVLCGLLNKGFLVLRRENGKSSKYYEGNLRLKRQFSGYSYLVWSGKDAG